MKKKWFLGGALFLILIAFVVGYSLYVDTYKVNPQQTIIFGKTKLYPGSKGTLRLKVLNVEKNKPVKANVKVSLFSDRFGEKELATSKTSKNGNCEVHFQVPELPEGKYNLKIQTESGIGYDKKNIFVSIKKDYKILLSTDKPLYQPSQTIHVRSLIMDKFHLKPVKEQKTTIEIFDPKNNKVFKKVIENSEFGLAACDFILASEVNQGLYKIKATCGNVVEEKKLQ